MKKLLLAVSLLVFCGACPPKDKGHEAAEAEAAPVDKAEDKAKAEKEDKSAKDLEKGVDKAADKGKPEGAE